MDPRPNLRSLIGEEIYDQTCILASTDSDFVARLTSFLLDEICSQGVDDPRDQTQAESIVDQEPAGKNPLPLDSIPVPNVQVPNLPFPRYHEPNYMYYDKAKDAPLYVDAGILKVKDSRDDLCDLIIARYSLTLIDGSRIGRPNLGKTVPSPILLESVRQYLCKLPLILPEADLKALSDSRVIVSNPWDPRQALFHWGGPQAIKSSQLGLGTFWCYLAVSALVKGPRVTDSRSLLKLLAFGLFATGYAISNVKGTLIEDLDLVYIDN